MSRAAIFFLAVVTLGLAVLLALLGWVTIQSNLLGWFLLITGLIYFFGIIIVYWIRGIRFWRPQPEGEMVKEERDDWSFWFIVMGMVAAFYIPPIEYLFFTARLPRGLWIQIVSLLLTLFGSVLFIWARRALGKFYSGHVSVIEGQQLIQKGPYHFIRHPAYTGYLLITLGLALGYSSLAGFIAILFLLMPAVIYRIRVEDKLLAEHFGVKFYEYAAKAARLIPGVW
ncbi:MAG TPA: isoprenylcysteine carboxylmethyltransferase family protein [Anaerolineales bacterium]